MRNNKILGLSVLSLSIMAATSNAQTFQAEEIHLTPVNAVNTLTAVNADFSQWREDQKYQNHNFTDRIIVKYKNGFEAQALSGFASEKVLPKGLAKKAGHSLKHLKKLKNGRHVISLGKQKHINDVKAMVLELNNHADVEFAEPDLKRYLMAQNQPWGIADTQSDLLSDDDAANMTVCVIDSGYERANPDLNANNASGTNNSGTGNWYQNGGSHGTHVAGTIAAVNNSEGVVGIMPNTNVNLHIVKVFNAAGWGYTGELVDAVDTCVDNGAKVINMSLGGAGSSNAERNSLQAAADAGVLLIAASGNDGDATLSYPASYDSVMAVGALDQGRQHAEFSQYTSQVEISAPGEAILSTVAGDGRLGYITLGSTTYGNDEVVPQTHYIQSGGSFTVSNVNSSANGVLAACTLSGSSYSCSNVSGNICLAERNDNQKGSNYPEINPAKACADAGASGVIVYSNSARPGLQNPFLVDANTDVTVPTVSVNRDLGLQLMGQLGTNANLSVVGNQDYAYYNGTSMATPHVAGVAAIVWSNNPSCTATEVRNALKSTAIDLGTAGRDDKTGHGLVQAKAASDALAASCGGTTPPSTGGNVLANGVAKTNLAGSTSQQLSFTMEVPAGATDLNFNMAGGTGDADLYVKFGSAPTTSSYDCRPYKGGNAESCPIATAQAGTYHVKVIGYSAFSGVNLTGSFTEPSTGGGTATGGSASVTDITVARRAWTYYTIDIPAGMSTLDFNMSGGSGDADLYIRRGAKPTTSTYDCRPYKSGNTEACAFTNPVADTWHIGVYGYSAASGVSLDVTYNP
ncbi:S8 family serine peptidase [Colwellia polaris]|uniref:S8 family serine peptidase n=1 Tax=Colwellia polaris TaxID=326537 RepID=UPI000A1754B0|nr:S8 family serine peptidase [Colwellia polaris]